MRPCHFYRFNFSLFSTITSFFVQQIWFSFPDRISLHYVSLSRATRRWKHKSPASGHPFCCNIRPQYQIRIYLCFLSRIKSPSKSGWRLRKGYFQLTLLLALNQNESLLRIVQFQAWHDNSKTVWIELSRSAPLKSCKRHTSVWRDAESDRRPTKLRRTSYNSVSLALAPFSEKPIVTINGKLRKDCTSCAFIPSLLRNSWATFCQHCKCAFLCK